MKTIVLNIQGMSCSSCVSRVEKKLKAVAGVNKAIVNLGQANATVDFDESKTKEEEILNSVEEAGYDVELKK